jgi:hypothetical protein
MYKSAETNIRGYHVEFEINDDDGYPVSSCWVSLKFVNSPKSYCSSLARLESEGILEADEWEYDDKKVDDATVALISNWAYDQGY